MAQENNVKSYECEELLCDRCSQPKLCGCSCHRRGGSAGDRSKLPTPSPIISGMRQLKEPHSGSESGEDEALRLHQVGVD